jgi:protein MpaA
MHVSQVGILLAAALLGAGYSSADSKVSAAKTAASTASAARDFPQNASASICDELVRWLPGVQRPLCEEAGLLPSGAVSVNQRPILMRDVVREKVQPTAGPSATQMSFPIRALEALRSFFTFSNPPQAQALPEPLRVLVVGGIHGDELSSATLALQWMRLAREELSGTAQPVHWRFIPALNPDGLFMRPPRRMNASGVDLNRNFPTPNWAPEARIYWEKRTRKDPRRYPGPAPLSEPESQFLHAQMGIFNPHLIVSIHAPYGVLDFDGPPQPPPKLGRLYLDQVGIFPGSLGNYGGVHRGVPVVTIELPSAIRTPSAAEVRQMWLDLRGWMHQRLGDAPVTNSPAAGTLAR